MAKRGKLEIMENTLRAIMENKNSIKPTVLLRKSRMSSSKFKEYYNELLSNGFIQEVEESKKNSRKYVSLTPKGMKFLERYKVIVDFLDEFEL